MKKKLRSGLILLFSMLTLNAFGQYDFIQTVDGNQYWLDIETEDFDEIAVPDGRRTRRIPKSDIVLIEYMEDGLKILQKDKLKKVEPVAFSDNVEEFVKQGKRVYIPLASFIIQQRYGARKLRDLLMEDGYWKVVGCEEEADFILEYVFDDKGKDHASLLFSDRFGYKFMFSKSVDADWFVPTRTGEESAEELYEKYIFKGIERGKFNKLRINNKISSK